MSIYKKQLIKAEDERIVLFQQQKEILKAIRDDDKARLNAEALQYTYILKQLGEIS